MVFLLLFSQVYWLGLLNIFLTNIKTILRILKNVLDSKSPRLLIIPNLTNQKKYIYFSC